MKDFGMGICPECGFEFKRISSVHKFCKREHKKKFNDRVREVGRSRPGRKRPYSKENEAKRVRRDGRKIYCRDTAKKAFPIPGPCEGCGGNASHRHHDNYNKPLEIRWFCAPCHRAWHKVNKAIAPVECGVQIRLPM